jgi:hypothetical protein
LVWFRFANAARRAATQWPQRGSRTQQRTLADLLDGDLLVRSRVDAGAEEHAGARERESERASERVSGSVEARAARARAHTHQTTPYAPVPMGLVSLYLASTSNLVPHTMKDAVGALIACAAPGTC